MDLKVTKEWLRRQVGRRPRADRGGGCYGLLLVVARTLPQPFTWGQLVVEACKAYPDRFSLVGYPGVPDSNLVNTYLCGSRGLVARGALVRVDSRLYCVKGGVNGTG